MDIKVMGMFLFILCTLFDSMFAFNHTSAEAECIEDGGLASYKNFVGEERSDLDKAYDLKEGESAWISGYVNFSQFIAYQACAGKVNNSVLNYTLKENDIYNCLQKCTIQDNISYIGLQNEFCYCSQVHEFIQFQLEADGFCNPELINLNLQSGKYVSSIKANITLYSIISYKRLTWDQSFSEARGQCVKVRSDGLDMKYETESCYSKANSFICSNSALHRSLIGNCGLQQLHFCVISGSNAWMKSFKECLEYKGKLTNFVYTEIKGYLKANELYWTGIFRTFKIENKNVFPENNVCLSVKNINGKIVFDPANCSAEKKFICAQDFSKQTESTKFLSSKTTTPTRTENNKINLIVVYIAVGAVFAVALSIIITCFIFRKRKQLKATSTQNSRNSKDHVNNTTDKTLRGSISDVAQRPDLAQSVEDEVTYAIPDTAEKHSPLSDSEYDSIRVKGPGEQKGNKSKVATIEDHVYGFHSANPIDIDIEVYDHVEAARKTNVSKPTDGIYNTLAEDSETYNVLGLGNKEESSKSNANKRDMPYLRQTKMIFKKNTY